MFADLDESIRQLLIQRGNLDSGEVDIALDMPTREWSSGISKPTVNIYLYDVRENVEMKDPSPWTVRSGPNNTAIKSRPDVRMDLTYSITAFANAVEDEHRLLSRVLITLLQYPILPVELLQGQVAGQEIPTYTAQSSRVIQSPADYWGSIDSDIKPSIDYRAVLRIDLSQEFTVGLALTSKITVGFKEEESGSPADELPFSVGGRIHRSENGQLGLPAVKVTLLERGLDTVTDAEGRYKFSGLLPGTYTLVISAPDIDERREIQVPNENYDVGI